MRLRARPLLIALAAGSALAALSLPALGQDAPESLLPEGFGDPAPAPPPPPSPSPGAPAPDAPGPTRPAPRSAP
ncbi:MAG: hypothetical protein H7X93_03920, partial [Sphingomonadaceae bacterium]|nr:hypothetical protein [Sphingomonadaceae bacterium]